MTKLTTNRAVGLATAFAVLATVTAPIGASAATSTSSVEATVATVVTIGTSTTVGISVLAAVGGAMSSASDDVTISTNNASGYTLTMSNADTSTTMASGVNTIAAHTGTQATPTVLATNTWGYRIDGVGGFGAGPTAAELNVADSVYTWAGVPSSSAPNTIKTTTTTTSGDTIKVWYGVEADTNVPSGTYVDVVSYTATAN